MNEFLLIKRGLYWRPDRAGYTGLKREAGIYSKAEALKLQGDGTTVILASEAPEFAPGCCSEVKGREPLMQLGKTRNALDRILGACRTQDTLNPAQIKVRDIALEPSE